MATARHRSGILALILAPVVIALGGCGGSDAGGSTLTWFIFNEPSGALPTAAERCSKQSGGRYSIEFEFLPNDADSQREQLVRRLGAEDSSIDIVGMDVIWTGEFANAGWLEEFTGETERAVSRNVFPSVLETAMYEDALYGAPIWTNTELLWYRDDLVKKPPKTWGEMIAAAKQIGPEEGLIQVQGNRYEGLTVWVNQMIASAGTEILSGPEQIELAREPTERALSTMGRLSSSNVADPSITTSDEDTGRLAFQSGSSAFMINYPFVYPSAEAEAPDIFKVMKAAKYPQVDANRPSAPPLGGINLGVSAFSENKDLAFEAIECLVRPENQLEIASAGGLPPVREDLYDEKEIDEVYPGFAPLIRDSINDAVPRPSVSPAYQDISLAIQRAVHPTVDIDPQDAATTYDDLRDLLEQAINREGLL
ncbi:MAG TPA: ABC transporter substrate-binding protein [Solirubrobacterales bacterium]|nr:ABC transporter substrate-binding protein [Solirubrobacterales bacterium]